MFKITVSAIALVAALGTASAAHAQWPMAFPNLQPWQAAAIASAQMPPAPPQAGTMAPVPYPGWKPQGMPNWNPNCPGQVNGCPQDQLARFNANKTKTICVEPDGEFHWGYAQRCPFEDKLASVEDCENAKTTQQADMCSQWMANYQSPADVHAYKERVAERFQRATDEANKRQAAYNAARQQAHDNQIKHVADNVATEEARGYKPMTIEDFLLDGHQLATSETKVAVSGYYKRVGRITKLYPNLITALQQPWDSGLPVLIDDDTARRDTRQFFLKCDQNLSGTPCQITLLGHATICTITNLAGSQDIPCLKVEDGWN